MNLNSPKTSIWWVAPLPLNRPLFVTCVDFILVEKPAKIDYTNSYNWKSKTILIAEDEQVNYNLLISILSPTNVKILAAKSGRAAIELCKSNKGIDLILMDMKMPDIDGFEATRQIKRIDENIPIIAQTAYAMSTDEENCLKAGCIDYIPKPLRIDDLLSKIDRIFKKTDTVSTSRKKTVQSPSLQK